MLSGKLTDTLRGVGIPTVFGRQVPTTAEVNPASSTLNSLLPSLDKYDFAVFIFSADDLIRAHHVERLTVKDDAI